MSWGVVMGGHMGGWGVMELEGWRKGPWTVEEDRILIDYVRLHGEGRWNSVATLAGLKRNGKSCRLRWVNYLRPDLKRGHITAHEESIILELHARWGNRWSTIARSLPGRTDNEIKNYWRTHFKKKVKTSCDRTEKAKARLLKKQQFQLQQMMQRQGKHNHQLDMKRFMSLVEESDNSYNTNYKTFTMAHQVRPASEMSTSTTVNTTHSASSHDQVEHQSYNVCSSSSSMAETMNENMIMWDGLWSLDDVYVSDFSSAAAPARAAGHYNLVTPFS